MTKLLRDMESAAELLAALDAFDADATDQMRLASDDQLHTLIEALMHHPDVMLGKILGDGYAEQYAAYISLSVLRELWRRAERRELEASDAN